MPKLRTFSIQKVNCLVFRCHLNTNQAPTPMQPSYGKCLYMLLRTFLDLDRITVSCDKFILFHDGVNALMPCKIKELSITALSPINSCASLP